MGIKTCPTLFSLTFQAVLEKLCGNSKQRDRELLWIKLEPEKVPSEQGSNPCTLERGLLLSTSFFLNPHPFEG